MVQSGATTVDAFLEEVGEDRIDAIRRVRQLCLERLTGWEERMQWGMPGYGPAGSDARISFNNQKGHISLYVGKPTIDRHVAALKGASLGKGCIRYPNAGRIDFDLVGTMLSEACRAKGGTG